MISLTMSQIAVALGGQLVGQDVNITKVLIDSRIENKQFENHNCLFVALKGPHFDAHHFVEDAINAGAVGVVVEHQSNIDKPQIIVENTRIALAQIARLNRNQSKAKYIAITGSSGKTTVKEMIASILTLSDKVVATKGNLNNDIGVPLTLLEIEKSTTYGVVELGANHAGEVAFTADITRPDVTLVNNITAAHLQGFGDIHGVARAKAEIYSALSEDGIAIINADDDFYNYFDSKIKGKKLSYSVKHIADVYASDIQLNTDQSLRFTLNYKQQQVQIDLPLVGLHNVANALAAATCCIAVEISLEQIVSGLAKAPQVAGRLIVTRLSNGCRLIDDTYNANVSSMMAAIDLLKNYPEPTILIIGDMGELGELGRQYHEQVGEYAKLAGITKMFSCGVLTQFSQIAYDKKQLENESTEPNAKKQITHFSHQKELIIKLKNEANAGATLLVKGSRSAHMENIVQALTEYSKNNRLFDGNSKSKEKCAASLIGDQ